MVSANVVAGSCGSGRCGACVHELVVISGLVHELVGVSSCESGGWQVLGSVLYLAI